MNPNDIQFEIEALKRRNRYLTITVVLIVVIGSIFFLSDLSQSDGNPTPQPVYTDGTFYFLRETVQKDLSNSRTLYAPLTQQPDMSWQHQVETATALYTSDP